MIPLSSRARIELLKLARHVIETRVTSGNLSRPEIEQEFPRLDELQVERGSFVTLHKQGRLRGCIGNIVPVGALYDGVIRNAESAALHDPRFSAVSPTELPDLELEISALTPLEPFSGPREIVVGQHGIYLSTPTHGGVLLPQVASEHGWGAEEFLQQTAVKAGLPPDGWKTAQLYCFSAEVFSEKDTLHL